MIQNYMDSSDNDTIFLDIAKVCDDAISIWFNSGVPDQYQTVLYVHLISYIYLNSQKATK